MAAAEPCPKRTFNDLELSKDVVSIITKTFNIKLMSYIMNITQLYNSIHPPNHIINADNYNKIYFTSDLHADYRKFVQLLVNSGLIKIPNSDNYFEDDNIYNPSIITNCEWNGSGILLVIIGDLIDGKRGEHTVLDPYGSFEMLIHLLIYNLNVKGKKSNCSIIFTFGNHDINGIMFNESHDMYYKDFVHDTCKRYFGQAILPDNSFTAHDIRKKTLRFFYNLSPYIFIILGTKINPNEIICLHGGLHNDDGKQFNIDILNKFQSDINKNGLEYMKQIIPIKENQFNYVAPNRDMSGVLWSRFYDNHANESCSAVSKTKFSLIVVGHCPTNISAQMGELMEKSPIYNYCNRNFYVPNKSFHLTGVGCIVANCYQEETFFGAPRIVLVDTSLSSAFHGYIDSTKNTSYEKERSVQMLLTYNNPDIQVPNRHFNTLSQYHINNKSNASGIIYTLFPTAENIERFKITKKLKTPLVEIDANAESTSRVVKPETDAELNASKLPESTNTKYLKYLKYKNKYLTLKKSLAL